MNPDKKPNTDDQSTPSSPTSSDSQPNPASQPAAKSSSSSPTASTSTVSQPASSARKTNRNLLIIIGCSVAVIIIAIIVAIVLLNSDKSDQDNTNKDESNNGSSSMVNPNVGGTMSVGKVSLTYSESWTSEKSSDRNTSTICRTTDDPCYVLAMIESEKEYTLDEYAEAMVEVYEEEGYKVKEKISTQKLNKTDWKHVRMADDEATADFWFYINGDQYYILSRATAAKLTVLDQEDHAILDSLTVK